MANSTRKKTDPRSLKLPEGEWYTLDHYRIRRVLGRPKTGATHHLPCVLLHGFAASAYTFRELQPALSRHAETHNLDLPGMGYSEHPKGKYTLSFYVDFLLDYLDREKMAKIDLIAHSLGGSIAFLFALKHPERVQKLVLLAPLINFGRIQSGLLGKGLKALGHPFLGKPLIGLKGRWFAKIFLNQIIRQRHIITEDFVAAYYEPNSAQETVHGLYKIHRMLADEDNLAILGRIAELEVPCLVLWGEADPLLPVEDAEYLRKHGKQIEIETYPQAGHMLMHELHEKVSARISHFLFF